MAEIKYHEMPQPLGIYAGDLYRRATQYLKAAQALSPDDPDLSFPAQFLFAHALELMLKSYLASQGVTKKDIKNFNHRLVDIYQECCSQGLNTDKQVGLLVDHVAVMNSDHDFRYPSSYNILMPTIEHCVEIIAKLDADLSPIVTRKAISANLEFASETRHLRGKKIIRWSD